MQFLPRGFLLYLKPEKVQMYYCWAEHHHIHYFCEYPQDISLFKSSLFLESTDWKIKLTVINVVKMCKCQGSMLCDVCYWFCVTLTGHQEMQKTSRTKGIVSHVSLTGILRLIPQQSLLSFFNGPSNCGVEFGLAL